MRSTITKALLVVAVTSLAGLPATASARHGADDPVGHKRHAKHHHHQHHHHGADDRRGR
jgi:hypothetical protein